jgi:hypothetical protein
MGVFAANAAVAKEVVVIVRANFLSVIVQSLGKVYLSVK